jgi:hypothetical protein
MAQIESLFRPILDGHFMARQGRAWNPQGPYCHKKLCFVATDQALLVDVLRHLSERPDCHFVKYSTRPRDGMYLGRCFLVHEQAVGALWAEYKEHPRLLCSIQDDDFTRPFRPQD